MAPEGDAADPDGVAAGDNISSIEAVAGPRKSKSIASRRADSVLAMRLYRLSLKKALKLNSSVSRDAVMSELRQLLDKKVWQYVHRSDLSKTQMKKVIRSLMFLKQKDDAMGNFVKMKARLVAGGDAQDKSLYV